MHLETTTATATTVYDLSGLAGMHILLGALLSRVELMMHIGRIINHTFITWIAAAPH